MRKLTIWILALLCLATAVAAIDTGSLWARYDMEGTGDMEDSHGGHDIAEQGTVPSQTGKNGNARGPYSTSNYFYNASVPDVLQSLSVSMWVYHFETDAGGTFFRVNADGNGHEHQWGTYDYSPVDTMGYTAVTGSGGPYPTLRANHVESPGHWWMYTATLNMSNGNTSLFINGTLMDTDTAGTAVATALKQVTIGALDNGASLPAADSYFDEITIWSKELTAQDVADLWNDGDGCFYPFDSCDAATTDLTLQAQDDFNGSSINSFSVNISWGNGTVSEYSTTNGSIALVNISDSNLTINVTFYNATDYYNLTLYDQDVPANTSTTITAGVYQAVVTMQATEKVTGNATSTTFYTGSKSGTVFNLTAGNHNITAVTPGYYNRTQQFSISALTNTTQTITDVYSAHWNITIYNLINGSVVPNYDINITSLNYTSWTGENSSSTTGSYNFSAVNGTYQVTIDAEDYILHTFNFTVNATSGGVNFSLYTTNSLNFTFYDEETQACLSGYNITVELIGDLQAANYSTMNCTLYVDLLTPQGYIIRYDDTNGTYGERFYYFNLTNRSNTAIDLYLLNNGTEGYTAVTATVYDETNHHVEGAIIKALRYYLDTNSYIIVDMGKTNFEGVTTLNLKQNEEFYKFIIEYPQGTTKKTTEPTQIYASTLNFQILLSTTTGARWYKSVDTIANVTFDTTNNWFRLEWNDPQNTLSRICLHTNLLTQFRNETINNTCSTSAAGVMYHPVDNVTGYTYHSQALAYYSDPPAPLAAAYHTFLATNPIGAIGLFMLVLVTIAFMFVGRWNLAVAVVLTPIPTMVASVAGLIAIPAYVTVPIQIVAVIIAYIISTRA